MLFIKISGAVLAVLLAVITVSHEPIATRDAALQRLADAYGVGTYRVAAALPAALPGTFDDGAYLRSL